MTEVATPRRAATVMVLRDTPGDALDTSTIEVLLLRRSPDTPFVPGAHVFPGGAVDDGDHHGSLASLVDDLDDARASAMLGVDSGGLAAWIAAVRECLEEAGILLATDHAGSLVTPDHVVFDDLDVVRRDVESGRRLFADVLADHGLRLPLGAMAYVSQWITPEVSPRRYDTRFFVAAMPPHQSVRVDDWEAVDASWWTPTRALEAFDRGEIQLIEPTVASLALLHNFTTAAHAVTCLRAGAECPTRIQEPTGGIRVPLLSELEETSDEAHT